MGAYLVVLQIIAQNLGSMQRDTLHKQKIDLRFFGAIGSFSSRVAFGRKGCEYQP